ncbi:MAG: hypothetical protein ACLQPD_27175 [Desulfomonilaceae bacterium]
MQKDKKLRDDNLLQPCKIVSLWEMLEFYAALFVQVSQFLEMIKHADVFFRDTDWQPDEWKLLQSKLIKILAYHQIDLGKIRLIHSEKRAKKLLEAIVGINRQNIQKNSDQIKKGIDDLHEMFVEELEKHKLFIIRPERAEYYRKGAAFLGKNLLDEFPDLLEDANEGAACFAVGRYTACAFHLMRIMEYVVQQFALKLEITFDPNEDTWGVMLDRVKQKIDKWDKERKRPSPAKKKYAACYKSIDGMRPRRDDLIHHRDYYTDERVGDLKGRVKSCVEDYLKLPDWKLLFEPKASELKLVGHDSRTKRE